MEVYLTSITATIRLDNLSKLAPNHSPEVEIDKSLVNELTIKDSR